MRSYPRGVEVDWGGVLPLKLNEELTRFTSEFQIRQTAWAGRGGRVSRLWFPWAYSYVNLSRGCEQTSERLAACAPVAPPSLPRYLCVVYIRRVVRLCPIPPASQHQRITDIRNVGRQSRTLAS